MKQVTLFEGDNRASLRALSECSVPAILTDLPYEIASIAKRFGSKQAAPARTEGNDGAFNRLSRNFLGAAWDAQGISYDVDLWREMLRVLTPGAFAMCFMGARTYHRAACAAEDAGFIIHPLTGWVYGQGMSLAADLSKSMDKHVGLQGQTLADGSYVPASPEAKQWAGWRGGAGARRTALEPIIVAQKPLSEKSVPANLLKWGTGAMNIEATRTAEGRHPANIYHDDSEDARALFPSKAAEFFDSFPLAADDMPGVFYHAKAGAADRAGSTHPCLLPGEDVLTSEGFRPIETVGVGSLVLADDGTYRNVIDRFPSPADTVIYEIAVEGTNRTTTATDNHPFLVWRRPKKRTPLMEGEASWQNASDVRPGDHLMTPVAALSDSDGSEDAIWWLIFGLWVAEGCRLSGSNGHGYPSLTIAKARNSDLLPVIEKRFSSVSAYDRGACWQTVIFEAGLLDRFISMAGYGAKGKMIGVEILRQPEWARKAFLEGYLRGDGCMVRGAWRASTASEDLAATMPLLAASLGIKCSAYRFDATGKDSKIDGRVIPGGIVHKLYFAKGVQVVAGGIRYELRRVKQVTPRAYRGPVWNITVEERHTFQTRVGMSHNTVKPIGLMRNIVRLITPPGGTVLDPFAGSGTTAVAALAEGMNCILMEAEPEYNEFLRKRFNLNRRDEWAEMLGLSD